MKHLFTKSIAALALFAALAGCSTSNNNNNVTPASSYYFNCKVNGTSYSFANTQPQYISSATAAGGYQSQAGALFPSAGVEFIYDHNVSNADMLALAGRTITYNDTTYPHAELQFDLNSTANTYFSIDTASSLYNVKVSSITYVRQDSTLFNKIDVYTIKGTCSGIIEDFYTGSRMTLTDGDFNFLVSRVR